MNGFDVAARRAVQDDPAGHVRWLFPRLSKVRYSRPLDSQSAPRPGEPDRRCDTIFELVHEGGLGVPWAAVIELFTGPDPDALDRLLEYVGRFRRELRHGPHGQDRYRFAGALVFLTEGPAAAAIEDRMRGGDSELTFRPRLVRLKDEDAVATMRRIEQNKVAASVLAWVPLMAGGQSAEAVAQWRRVCEARETDEGRRRSLAGLAWVLAELTDSDAVWEAGLEGFAMRESRLMRQERQEGRQEGRQEATRGLLLRAVGLRFGEAVKSDLTPRVLGEDRPEELARWHDLVVTAKDAVAFKAAVG